MSKKEKITPVYIEGIEGGQSIVIDYVDIMVHLFITSVREKYQLEELWQKGKIVELEIQTDRMV